MTIATLAFFGTSCSGGTSPQATATVVTPAPVPTVSLTSSASTGYTGDPVTLTWSSTNATGCTASGGWSGTLATSGSQAATLAAGANNFSITCVNGAQSASSSVAVTATAKPFFVEISNALTAPTNVGGDRGALATTPTPVDLNGDGRKDLVVHFWGSRYSGGATGTEPAYNRLVFYVQQTDGTFRDQTSTYLVGSNDLGGASRKLKFADVNSDGKPDLVYAVNNEDFRSFPVASNGNAPFVVVLSTSAGYTVKKLNPPNWYHAAGVGRDRTGKAFVTANGYVLDSKISYYFDASGNATATGLTLPKISPTSFELFNDAGDNGFTDRLLQADSTYPTVLAVQGYTASSTGAWTTLPGYQVSPITGYIRAIGYNGDDQGLQPVFTVNGNVLAFTGMSETCVTRLSPSTSPVVIFGLSGQIVPSFVDGATVPQSSLQNYTTYIGTKIEGGAIKRVPFTITGEQTAANTNHFECRDINADGYADLITHPYNSNGKPYVYLNNKSDGFSYIGQTQFPSITDSWGSAVSSILDDLDGDGIDDLILFPGNGAPTATATIQWRVYKGLKRLE